MNIFKTTSRPLRLSDSEKDKEGSDNKSIISNVIKELGGVVFVAEAANRIFPTLRQLSKNKLYRDSLSIINSAIPVALISYQIYGIVKAHISKPMDVFGSKINNIKKILGLHESDYADYNNIDFGNEVLTWLLSNNHHTDDFTIMAIFNKEFNQIQSISDDDREIFLLIKTAIGKHILDISSVVVSNKRVSIKTNIWNDNTDYEIALNIRNIIFKSFIKNFDIKHNIIVYDRLGLKARPRIDCGHPINQVDVDSLTKEIMATLDKNKKRGYAFIGPPGTGKTSIILKIESNLIDYPIVYGSAAGFRCEEDISGFFAFVKMIGKCIVILEDLDSYGLNTKNGKTGEFLDGFDLLKSTSSFIMIVSLNDTSGVHHSLLDRRGRIDTVIFVDIPKTKEDVLAILRNKITKEYNTLEKDINIEKVVLEEILKNKFTHADICEMIENNYINDKELTTDNLFRSIESLKNTRNNIMKCNFSNNNDNNNNNDNGEDPYI